MDEYDWQLWNSNNGRWTKLILKSYKNKPGDADYFQLVPVYPIPVFGGWENTFELRRRHKYGIMTNKDEFEDEDDENDKDAKDSKDSKNEKEYESIDPSDGWETIFDYYSLPLEYFKRARDKKDEIILNTRKKYPAAPTHPNVVKLLVRVIGSCNRSDDHTEWGMMNEPNMFLDSVILGFYVSYL